MGKKKVPTVAPAAVINSGHGELVCSNIIGEHVVETYEDGFEKVVPLWEFKAEQEFREYLAEQKRLAEEKAAKKLRIPVYPEEDEEEFPRQRKRGKVNLTGYVSAKVEHILKDNIHRNDEYYRALRRKKVAHVTYVDPIAEAAKRAEEYNDMIMQEYLDNHNVVLQNGITEEQIALLNFAISAKL